MSDVDTAVDWELRRQGGYGLARNIRSSVAAHKLLLSIPVYVVHFCKAGKCLRIVSNKDHFTHTFLGIEDLCAKRDDLHRQILQEEEEKQKIQNDIRILTERLAQVTPPPPPPPHTHTH